MNGLESLKYMTCETHVKCPSCMIGKATLEDLPKAKKVITKPCYQIHMDSFSSSVKSIVLVDAASGYRWIYSMKTKDDALHVVKRWFGDIADLLAKHKLAVLMRDNACEYKSEEIMQFLESKGIRSHFSTPKEKWQNGAAESTINSIMLVRKWLNARLVNG